MGGGGLDEEVPQLLKADWLEMGGVGRSTETGREPLEGGCLFCFKTRDRVCVMKVMTPQKDIDVQIKEEIIEVSRSQTK